MKTAKFEILGLEIPIGKFQEYHDDGLVLYIPFKAEELSETYASKGGIPPCLYALNPSGLAVSHESGIWPFKTQHVHIFYKKGVCEPEEFYVRAHEETHAISMLGKLGFLERAIKHKLKLKKRFRSLGEELRANVGGAYALLSRGFSVDQIRETRPADSTDIALQILGLQ